MKGLFKPETIQTINAMLTEPVFFKTPLGLINIPEPIIEPTITLTPFTFIMYKINELLYQE